MQEWDYLGKKVCKLYPVRTILLGNSNTSANFSSCMVDGTLIVLRSIRIKHSLKMLSLQCRISFFRFLMGILELLYMTPGTIQHSTLSPPLAQYQYYQYGNKTLKSKRTQVSTKALFHIFTVTQEIKKVFQLKVSWSISFGRCTLPLLVISDVIFHSHSNPKHLGRLLIFITIV